MENFIHILFQIPLAFAQKAQTGDVTSETTDQITGLVTFVIGQIPLWITAIIVLVMTFIISRIVKSSVENRMTAEGFEEEHKEVQIVASRTASAAVLIIGITVALKIAGIDLTPIIAAGAFGMGFALQDLIMNFVAGVMILSGRQIAIGDTIQVNGTLGKVVEIQTRATVLKAFNGTKIMVPNSDLFKNQVTNFSANPYRRIQLVNGVAYGTDLKNAMKIILDAVKNTKNVLITPKPSVIIFEWGDSSINFKINAWVEKAKILKAKNNLMINITKALDDAGIEIPFPTQTINLAPVEADKMILGDKDNKPIVANDSPTAAPLAVSSAENITPVTPLAVPATPVAVPLESSSPQNTPIATSVTGPEVQQNTPEWLQKAKSGLDNQTPTLSIPVPMGALTIDPLAQVPAAPIAEPAPITLATNPASINPTSVVEPIVNPPVNA